MAFLKKHTRKNKEEALAKVMAIQTITRSVVEDLVVKKLILLEDKSCFRDVPHMNYIGAEIGKELGKNKEFIEGISGLCYTESEEDDVHISEEGIKDAVATIDKFVTQEYVNEFVKNFNSKNASVNKVIETAKMKFGRDLDDEIEVISEKEMFKEA